MWYKRQAIRPIRPGPQLNSGKSESCVLSLFPLFSCGPGLIGLIVGAPPAARLPCLWPSRWRALRLARSFSLLAPLLGLFGASFPVPARSRLLRAARCGHPCLGALGHRSPSSLLPIRCVLVSSPSFVYAPSLLCPPGMAAPSVRFPSLWPSRWPRLLRRRRCRGTS